MKVDFQFPPAPQFRQAALPCDDIKPPRLRALLRLGLIADKAEGLMGIALDGTQGFPANSAGFAAHCATVHSAAAVIGGMMITGAKQSQKAADEYEGVMLINPRHYWGTLGPIRGDIVIDASGLAAVVTQPLCNGCADFEAVALCDDGTGVLSIGKGKQWLAGIKWIVRAIDDGEWTAEELGKREAAKEAANVAAPSHEGGEESPRSPEDSAAPDMASPDVRDALQAEGAGENSDSRPGRRKRSGIG